MDVAVFLSRDGGIDPEVRWGTACIASADGGRYPYAVALSYTDERGELVHFVAAASSIKDLVGYYQKFMNEHKGGYPTPRVLDNPLDPTEDVRAAFTRALEGAAELPATA